MKRVRVVVVVVVWLTVCAEQPVSVATLRDPLSNIAAPSEGVEIPVVVLV